MPSFLNFLTVDVILYILLATFALYGFWFGLIHTVGGIVGVVLGSIFAGQLYGPIANKLAPIVGTEVNVVKIVSFIVIFLLINRAISFGFWIIDRIFKFISIIPFLKSINRIAGAVFGLIEGAFIIGGILFILIRFPVLLDWQKNVKDSVVAKNLVNTYSVMFPLLPSQLREFDIASFFFNKFQK